MAHIAVECTSEISRDHSQRKSRSIVDIVSAPTSPQASRYLLSQQSFLILIKVMHSE